MSAFTGIQTGPRQLEQGDASPDDRGQAGRENQQQRGQSESSAHGDRGQLALGHAEGFETAVQTPQQGELARQVLAFGGELHAAQDGHHHEEEPRQVPAFLGPLEREDLHARLDQPPHAVPEPAKETARPLGAARLRLVTHGRASAPRDEDADEEPRGGGDADRAPRVLVNVLVRCLGGVLTTQRGIARGPRRSR